jgi:prolyl oligopeptidase
MSLISGVASSVEERLHGVVVRDPYRWLEDGDSAETRAWIADRQHHYEEYFRESADLNWFRSHVREHLDVETVDQPARIGTLYFYRRRNKGSEQACIYVRDSPSE